jgi:hypothetical protein
LLHNLVYLFVRLERSVYIYIHAYIYTVTEGVKG